MPQETPPVKILVIDDEAAVRHSFADYLEDQNFEVLTAENGLIGLDLFKREKPQMMMVDLRMPELDGLELLKLSSELDPDIPKIVISGANQIDDVVQALRFGAWDYLVKPVKDLSMLGHAVDSALEKSRLLRENRSYQKHLEQLVSERTQKLELANKRLSVINSRLKKIVGTTQGLSACFDIHHFGSRLLDEFARHMAATGGSLYIIEQNGLRRLQSLDPVHAPDFIKFPLADHSILNQVITNGEPLLVEDLSNAKNIQTSGWSGYKGGSLLAFPLSDNEGKIIGVINLHSKKDPPFIEEDKEFGSILASYSCETLRAVQAFDALQESEKQYKALFEKTNDAIFIVERSTGRYIDANEAAVVLTGRKLAELKQLTLEDVSLECAEKWLATPEGSETTEELGEITYRRPDNTSRVAKVSSIPLNNNVVVCIARDITHDLEIESQLRQSQKMEAIGTLAGGIAHDFNNILASIFGYAQLAEMDINNPEKAKKNIRQVVKGAQRAADLVQQILTFSKKTEQNQSPLKLFTVVREAVKFLRSSIPTTIEIDEQVVSKSTILADATQAHQVVMNLCTNAYHAMRKSGGLLSVELADVEITQNSDEAGYNRPGKYVRLEVKDTGHGIDSETLKRVFDPYFTTKASHEGTGLGLAVVDGIVKKHNGFIRIFSEIGKGSTFRIFWPVYEIEAAAGNHIDQETELLKGNESVMLVDDESDILETVQPILESQGYNVTAFNNSLSAYKEFSTNPDKYDIVITDITMPKMTGDELSSAILKIRKDMPIILCTGFSEKFTREDARRTGINTYINKPVTGQDLSATIRNLLDQNG